MDRHHRSTKHPGMSPDPTPVVQKAIKDSLKSALLVLQPRAVRRLDAEAKTTLYQVYEDYIHQEYADAEIIALATLLLDRLCPERVITSAPDDIEDPEDLDPDQRDIWQRREHERHPPEDDHHAPSQHQAAINPAPWWPCCRREV